MPEASPKGITKVTITDFNGDPIAGGTGGGPASIADGLDVAQGTTTDPAWSSGAGTVISLLKKIASSGAAAGLTDAQLRASAVPVSGPLTDTQIRASALPVSGTFWQATQPVSIAAAVDVSDRVGRLLGVVKSITDPVAVTGTFFQGTQPVSLAAAVDVSDRAGRLLGIIDKGKIWDGTNTAAVTGTSALKVDGSAVTQPVSGTFWQATQPVSIAASVTVSGPLTDAQLRASAVPVSGPLTDTQLRASAVPVDVSDRAGRLLGIVDKGKVWDGTNIAAVKAASTAPLATDPALVVTISPNSPATGGGLTDTQLRASAVPVSLASTTITGSVAVTGPLTDTQLRASAVPVSGPLTDTQLRASAVPVTLTSTTITGTVTADVSDRVGRLLGVVKSITDPVAVTGTFWQATQPVSLAASVAVTGPLTDAQLRAAAVPVSGTFWQATQPVSGTFWQATQPVSGTFWQATQPVSGPLTDAQLRASAVPVTLTSTTITGTVDVSDRAARALGVVASITNPVAVTGTFWQATQPVSIAASVAVTGPLTDAQLRAAAVPVSGTFFQTTQPISGTIAEVVRQASVERLLELLLVESQQQTLQTLDPKYFLELDPGIMGTAKIVPSASGGAILAGTTVNRSGLSVYNNGTSTLYLLAAPGQASTTLFTAALTAGGYYELPNGVGGVYKGPVSCYWSAVNGSANVTEWTT